MMLPVDRLHMIPDLEADDREIAALAQQHAALGMLHHMSMKRLTCTGSSFVRFGFFTV